MAIPEEVCKTIESGKCILFLGAMASAATIDGTKFQYKKAPPSGAELSRRLAKKCEYPDQDITNLQRVSLFYQFRHGGSRQLLVEAIREEITKYRGPEGNEENEEDILPSPALHILAELPFPIIITTNYDRLFDIVLGRANTLGGKPKQPIITIYDPEPNQPPETVPLDPSEEKPILLKLHGDIDRPKSIVVTEEDYIRFIHKMSLPHHHPIHPNIRARLNTWPILFVGYSLKDYNLRLLFRTLRWHVDIADFPISYSVDPYPDNIIVSILQHGEKPMVSFIEENLWDLIPSLYEKCFRKEYVHDNP